MLLLAVSAVTAAFVPFTSDADQQQVLPSATFSESGFFTCEISFTQIFNGIICDVEISSGTTGGDIDTSDGDAHITFLQNK